MRAKSRRNEKRGRPLVALSMKVGGAAEAAPRKSFVAYYRASTQRQGADGLGIDAQKRAVGAFINGNADIVEEFTEIESGRRDDRPELDRALLACRAHGATLAVAKLDRLSRSVRFISALMDSGVEFVCCDMPEANRLTLHVLAAVAEHERQMISDRTRAALAAAKARGTKLGNPRARSALRIAREVRSTQVAERRGAMRRMIEEVTRAAGATSLREIAAALTARGMRTPRGGTTWHATQVARALGSSRGD